MKKLYFLFFLCAPIFLAGAVFALWSHFQERSRSDCEAKILQLLDDYCYRQAHITLLNQENNFIGSNPPLAARVFRLNNDAVSANKALALPHTKKQEKDWDFQQVLLRLESPKWKDQLDYALFLSQQDPSLANQIMESLIRGCMARMEPLIAGQWIEQWKKQNGDIRSLVAEATLHEYTDHLEDALEILERITATAKTCSPEIEAKAGSILLSLNKPDQAFKHWAKALETLPDQPDWILETAKTMYLLGQTEKSLDLLNELLEKPTPGPDAFAERGKQLLQSGKAVLALPDLEKALALEPSNVIAAENYRKALFETGDEMRAGEWTKKVEKMRSEQERLNTIFQKELPAQPQDANLMAEAAGIFLRSGHPKSALLWAQKALAVDPVCVAANSLLAGYYEAIGNPGLSAEHKRLIPRPKANQ